MVELLVVVVILVMLVAVTVPTPPSSSMAIVSPVWTVSRNSSPSMSTVTMRCFFQMSAISTPAAASVSMG